ncbi:MAG: type II secretion system F family protein [Pirellulaceae bacterium]|nr:type II secretion system F family protein [Pirellulaceae bacterium]
MPIYAFTARDANGTPREGTLEAASPNDAATELRDRGWLIISVNEQTATSPNTSLLAKLPFLGPSSLHVEISLQQIAVMLRGGLTLLSSLNTCSEQAPRASMRRIWAEVIERIQEGASFSDALSEYSCIPDYAVRLIRVGEQTGVLESVLVQAAQMMTSRREAKRDLMTALAYPSIVVVAATGVTTYMVTYLIPKLSEFLRGIGKELPAMTQFLMDISEFVQQYGFAILGGILTTLVAFTLIYMSQSGRLACDRIALRLPIIGRIFRLSGTTTFSQCLGILVRSGITVLEGLVTVEQLHYNRFLAQTVQRARESVMQGRSLADTLKVKGAYMPLLTSMTAVAEQAGNLDEVLDEVSRFHENQLKSMIRQLAAWITPVVTIVVGGIVGFVYIAFFLALFAAAG